MTNPLAFAHLQRSKVNVRLRSSISCPYILLSMTSSFAKDSEDKAMTTNDAHEGG